MMIASSIRPAVQLSALVLPFVLGCGSSTPPPRGHTHAAPEEVAAAPESDPAGENTETQHAHDDHEDHGAASQAGGAAEQEGSAQPVDLAAAERAAYAQARPVFDKYCAKCHTTAGAKAKASTLEHFSMDQYPFGGHHAAELGSTIPEVLGATGDEPTMPLDDPGAVQGQELALILEWAKAFERSHAAGLHDHGDHHGHGQKHQH